MRVVVLGAGLLGVTSAYYLQQLGHEVTVVDRHATPAAKARGRVTPEGADAQRPDLPSSRVREKGRWLKLYNRLRRRFAGLMDRAIGERRKADPVEHLVRLAAYSRKSVLALSDEAGMPQGSRTAGLLNIYTNAEVFKDRTARASYWRKLGCEERLLTADEAVGMEPALQSIHGNLAGASYSHEDPARDPSQFAASLVFLCRAAGVRFMTKQTVVSLQERDGRIDHVELVDAEGQPSTLRAQAYVLALGSSSVPHAEHLNIAMPLRFVREYTVTLPVKDAARAPRITLRDRQCRLRITRIETPAGECLRVSGTVQASPDEQREPDSDRFDAILRRIETLFPGAADRSRATLETMVHAASTSRLPMIGKTRLRNLFLNTAPGAQGWIHACGAGKSIARIVSGLRPELEFAFTGF
jgi:D-amino-acid dehydrogenase